MIKTRHIDKSDYLIKLLNDNGFTHKGNNLSKETLDTQSVLVIDFENKTYKFDFVFGVLYDMSSSGIKLEEIKQKIRDIKLEILDRDDKERKHI